MSILNEEIDRVGQLVGSLAEVQPRRRRHAGLCGRRGQGGRGRAAPVPHHRLRPPTSRSWWRTWEEGARIDGDPDILKQILVNLVKNAIEALARAAAASRSPTAATSTASASCTSNWWYRTPGRACRAKCWRTCSRP
jgi:signal transduction histidine kinase